MSLSLALSSALSGLALSSRGTQIVADNIANAQTEGYGVRSLDQAARVLGQSGSGVAITGVVRHVNQPLLAELRDADGLFERNAQLGAFWQRFEAEFGAPGEAGSLSNNLSRLSNALRQASLSPDQTGVLQQVAQSASAVARNFVGLHGRLQQERDDADAAIAREIGLVNRSLESIADLNRKIQRQTLLGGSPEALLDTRQRLVDEVSIRIPVREFAREDGRIMLMAQDGSILVDRDAVPIGFKRSVQPTPHDRIETGAVSALLINGNEIVSDSAMFGSGRIGALLQVRDFEAPALQADLDRIVADLIKRFADLSIDPSLAPGQFGLFSLSGLSDMPQDITGISGRLQINPLINPSDGGDLWRLRDGLNAVAPGPNLNNAILTKMLEALEILRPLEGTAEGRRSIAFHTGDLLSKITSTRLDVEEQITFSSARYDALREAFSAKGVDVDAELSKLLILEQAYSANARVLSTIDAMMQTILEI